MRIQQKDSVQSRFTAYVVAALENRRMRYLEICKLDVQYHAYVSDREALITENWTDLDTLTELLQTPH